MVYLLGLLDGRELPGRVPKQLGGLACVDIFTHVIAHLQLN